MSHTNKDLDLMSNNNDQTCRCPCGATEFTTTGAPLFRLLCHCTICQEFNAEPFGDVVVFRAVDVARPAPEKVAFDTYRPPPNVQRGKCKECEKAAIEVFESWLMPDLVMVPRHMLQAGASVPEPIAHVFYHRRVSDARDALAKHQGYWGSQLAFGKFLLGSLFSRKI